MQRKITRLVALVSTTLFAWSCLRSYVARETEPSSSDIQRMSSRFQATVSTEKIALNTTLSPQHKRQRNDTLQTIRDRLVKGTGTYRLSQPLGRQQKVELIDISPYSWSQYAQDLVIDHAFHGKRGGFFVEIGGYDGETLSNTLRLEKQRGWNGLLVEANPYLFKKMIQRDRQCFMINCCISNEEQEMTFLLADLLTASKNHLTGAHKARIDFERNESLSDPHYGEVVTTQCFSLMDILDVIGQRNIDYFSLDVEGGELHILKSLDWDKLNIKYFSIETDQNRKEILAFMDKHGYVKTHHILGDHIFKKRSIHSGRLSDIFENLLLPKSNM